MMGAFPRSGNGPDGEVLAAPKDDGQRLNEGYVLPGFRDDESYPPVTVKKGYYYVLGDHRNSSNDSRNWGEVPEKYIYGKAVFRFWPLRKVGLIR